MADWGAVLTAVGGMAVVSSAIAGFVSKIVTDRLVESHKASLGQETERLKAQLVQDGDRLRLGLKKQELLFAKELEAASAYMKLHREIEPKYRHPDMEWHEALDEVLDNLRDVGEKLESFILEHGAVISASIRKDILELRSLAEIHKFDDARENFDRDREYSKEAVAAAEKILNDLSVIEDRLLQDVRSWEQQGPR
jgi:aspartokinase